VKKKLRDDVLTFYKKMGEGVDLILGPSSPSAFGISPKGRKEKKAKSRMVK
jgi:hypothetical protein